MPMPPTGHPATPSSTARARKALNSETHDLGKFRSTSLYICSCTKIISKLVKNVCKKSQLVLKPCMSNDTTRRIPLPFTSPFIPFPSNTFERFYTTLPPWSNHNAFWPVTSLKRLGLILNINDDMHS